MANPCPARPFECGPLPAQFCHTKDTVISRSEDISTRIIRHLSGKDYRPQRMHKLARSMNVDDTEMGDFRVAVRALMKAGRVVKGEGNSVMLPDSANTIVGMFRGNQRGFGFVVPSAPGEHEDLFIPPPATLDAMTGDTVVARITRRGKRNDPSLIEGEIVQILERGKSRFVGELVRQGESWIMLPDGHALHGPVLIADAAASRGRAGDQVVVELTEYPQGQRPARGVIIDVLGRRGDPGVDIESIIHQYHLHSDFPPEVNEEARRVVREYDFENELGRREDLRDDVVVTIDPDDAKDYDDAISIRRLDNGNIELGVHIADVSTFVRPGTPLDEEANLRGNSVYFPGHVLPMLPEVLSNGLCSLQQGEPRLVKSAFIEYDDRGRRKAKRYANAVIQSNRRLTYGEATQIIEGKSRGFKREVVDLVRAMEKLARSIQKRRLDAGTIVLDLPDVEIVLDENDEMTGVEPADTSFSHTIIEMFMIEANEAVAELFVELNVPHLRRIHPEPPSDAQRKLTSFLRVLGRAIPKKLERGDMIRLLDSVKGTDESFAVNLAVLRSMSQAEYSPKTIGHFALASKHYSHFTSPIRRYPDLVIHRLLDEYLEGRLSRKKDVASAPSTETLAQIGAHCSFTERHAEAAERELKLVKTLRFLEHRIGDEEDGVVTGVANIGVYVQLRKYLVDGLIRFDDLPDDWWDINTRAGCVVGQRTRTRIAIGDAVRVRIAGVDLAARQLDLILTETVSGRRESKREVRDKKKARSTPARKAKTAGRSRGPRTGKTKKSGPPSRGKRGGRGRR